MTRYVGIDPSTKLGKCILNEDGKVLEAVEITSEETHDPARLIDLTIQAVSDIERDDWVFIEGFSYGSKGSAVDIQYGLGWLIRAELYRRRIPYIEVSPNSLKKFAAGKGNCKKDAMVLPIYKKWGFESDSDNIRDAYVLSRVAMAMSMPQKLTAYQQEAINNIHKEMRKNEKRIKG
ncbi:hypothetical protein [Priestia megaterium]|uniref:hypothetical protein n=1 Tax=Priestia megaterium TaxID=1404 RepID=UPI0028144FC0|nr:hypothetical protein [Priestia megaterium]MDR0128667.1 hypothetical protein [Priestia megaterium]